MRPRPGVREWIYLKDSTSRWGHLTGSVQILSEIREHHADHVPTGLTNMKEIPLFLFMMFMKADVCLKDGYFCFVFADLFIYLLFPAYAIVQL